jgi:hypothetical protein
MAPADRELAIVAHVATEVGKLSVNDKPASINNPSKIADTYKNVAATTTDLQDLQPPTATPPNDGQGDTAAPNAATQQPAPTGSTNQATATTSSWKRLLRKEDNTKRLLTTQGCSLGAPRPRPGVKAEDQSLQPMTKKVLMQVPSLEDSLGKENLAKLRQEEVKGAQDNKDSKTHADGVVQGSQEGESLNIVTDNQIKKLTAGASMDEANLMVQLEQGEEVDENTVHIREKKKKSKETSLRSDGMKLGAMRSARRNK